MPWINAPRPARGRCSGPAGCPRRAGCPRADLRSPVRPQSSTSETAAVGVVIKRGALTFVPVVGHPGVAQNPVAESETCCAQHALRPRRMDSPAPAAVDATCLKADLCLGASGLGGDRSHALCDLPAGVQHRCAVEVEPEEGAVGWCWGPSRCWCASRGCGRSAALAHQPPPPPYLRRPCPSRCRRD